MGDTLLKLLIGADICTLVAREFAFVLIGLFLFLLSTGQNCVMEGTCKISRKTPSKGLWIPLMTLRQGLQWKNNLGP